jgi:hypothetical protein
MAAPLPFDDDLLHRLPLPLAQLYVRAGNAKTPLDRHLAAYLEAAAWHQRLRRLSEGYGQAVPGRAAAPDLPPKGP